MARKNREKTKAQLIEELDELQRRVAELEADEAERTRDKAALRTTIDALDEAIHVVDADMHLVMINTAVRRQMELFQLNQEVLGKVLSEAFPFLPPRVMEEYQQVLDTGQPLTTEECTSFGAVKVFTETRKIPIFTEGEITRIVTCIRDITRHKLAREELSTLLEISQALMTTIELEAVLQLTIDNAVRALGLETGAIYLLRGGQLHLGATTPPLPPEMPEEFRVALLVHHPHIGNAISTGFPVYLPDIRTAELTPQEKDISEARGLRSLLYVPLSAGTRVVGVLILGSVSQTRAFSEGEINLCQTFSAQMALAVENALLHQRTQLYADELEELVAERTAELEKANEELQVLNQMKDEFVANVSHELRSPLASLKIHHYLLEKRPERLDQYLPVVQRETFRLERTIEDLLYLSRLDQGRVKVKRTLVDLGILSRQYVNDRLPLAEERELTLRYGGETSPALVQADEGLIQQILGVLLTNALNYTPAGGQIVVSTQTRKVENRQWVGFSVRDTGPGILPEEQEQLFTRFFRGEAGRISKVQGTGLGLAIAKEIVEYHLGHIELESKLGQGTTVKVWLPGEEDRHG